MPQSPPLSQPPSTAAGEWSAAAANYAHVAERLTALFCPAVVASLHRTVPVDEKRPLVVMDVATGTGVALPPIAEWMAGRPALTRRLIATDISPAMVAVAETAVAPSLPASVSFGAAVVDAATFDGVPDASLDAATWMFGIKCLRDPPVALAALRRVLRPGAVAVVTTWHYSSLGDLRRGAAAAQGLPTPAPRHDPRHGSEGPLRAMYATCGLSVEAVEFVSVVCSCSPEATATAFVSVPGGGKLRWDTAEAVAFLRTQVDADGHVPVRATAIVTTVRNCESPEEQW